MVIILRFEADMMPSWEVKQKRNYKHRNDYQRYANSHAKEHWKSESAVKSSEMEKIAPISPAK